MMKFFKRVRRRAVVLAQAGGRVHVALTILQAMIDMPILVLNSQPYMSVSVTTGTWDEMVPIN
jgi:hypothetical protein